MNYFNERAMLQTDKFIGTSTLWGGERLGLPIPSPLQNVLIVLFIFQSLGLCYSFTVSELYESIPKKESSF